MNDAKKPGSLVALVLAAVVVVAAIGLAVYFWPRGEQPSPIEPEKLPEGSNANKKEKDSSNGGNAETVLAVADQPGPQTLAAATEFLYSGPAPVQVGMAKEALDPKRAAALRGLVFKQKDEPFPGVHVAIQNQPRYGVGASRPDGSYDMVVNGGGLMTVGFTREGYLPVWRQAAVPWQDYTWLPPVVMTTADSNVTPVKSESKSLQVARGNVVSDKDGKRQTTLIFPAETKATIELPDGTKKPLDKLSVRATEYTVGDKGPERMPAPLPANSGYTYCVELSADEAVKAGAKTVRFAKPVYHYVENFLNFPVGVPVPVGYFDPEKGAWIPSESGRMIKILDIQAGLAILDVDGKGKPADPKELAKLKLGDEERKELAQLYKPGTSVWRAPIPHFSVWDCNWGFSPPKDAVSPGQPPPRHDPPDKKPVRETVRIPGIDWNLHYHSDRTPSATPPRSIDIPVAGKTIPTSLKRIEIEIYVAGRRFDKTLTAKPEQTYKFTWDGKDAFGRRTHGAQNVKVRIGYVYDGVYELTPAFGANGNGEVITGSRTRQEVVFWQEHLTVLGGFDARSLGLGGWSFGVQHAYDPVSRTLYLGTGARHTAQADGTRISNQVINTAAGGSVKNDLGDGGPAWSARLDDPKAQTGAGFSRNRFPHWPRGLAIAPDGTMFLTDANDRIRRIDLDGKISTIAGGGTKDAPNGKATDLKLHYPRSLALRSDGSLYVAEVSLHRVRRLDKDGTLTTVVGGNGQGFAGDGEPAIKAKLHYPNGLAVTPDGTLYIADQGNNCIRRVTPDGIITTIAGTGKNNGKDKGYSGDGDAATKAQLYWPTSLALGPDGSLYFSDQGNYVIRRVSTSGIIATVAGTYLKGWSNQFDKSWSHHFDGDGGPALKAKFDDPTGLAVAADGSLYIADTTNHRIRRVGPDGIIRTFAGADKPKEHGDFAGDNGPARLAKLSYPTALAFGPDGNLCFYDASYQQGAGDANSRHVKQRIRRITPALPGFSNEEIAVASPDGKELFRFNAVGQHFETLDADSKAQRLRLDYDQAGRLKKIAATSGHVVKIERDEKGNAQALVSQQGQKTALEFPQEPGWRMQDSGVSSDLTSVSFVNDKLGFAVGSQGIILRTKDGGKSWHTILEPVKSGRALDYIQFTDAKNGWAAAGILGTIMQTKDGGDSWKTIPIPGGHFPGSAFASISPVGSGCYLQFKGFVYHSADGQPFQLLNKTSPGRFGQAYGGMSMVNDTFGAVSWSVSNARYFVALTMDGGKTWTEKEVTDKKLLRGQSLGVQFVNTKTGWLYSGYGKILATTDGGNSWTPQDPGQADTSPLKDLHFVDTKLGYLLTTDGVKNIPEVRRTTDGGKTWQVLGQLRPSKGYVRAVRFVDENHGWVVGDKGYIEHFGKAGRVTNITDASGHAAKIERDALKAGRPESIVATQKEGQKTAMELNANGYLERLTYPDGSQVRMEYSPDGLLKQIAPPPPSKIAIAPRNQEDKKAPVEATTTQGSKIVFPSGDISWADEVVSFKMGDPAPRLSRDPKAALGKPDYRGKDDAQDEASYVALGHGGELVLKFTDNVLVDGKGPDLAIFEIGGQVEPILVAISEDGKNWIDVGRVEGATCSIDIAPFVKLGQQFRFVKLTDAKAGRSNGTSWPGADIDAVGAINTLPVLPAGKTTVTPPKVEGGKGRVDVPNDGVADGLNEFPDPGAKPGAWQIQDSGVKDDLHGVAFITDQVGVAVGANYTILRTTNAGNTWNRVMGPKDQGAANFAGVVFANDKVGYVRNQFTGDVFRTTDAGATWQHIKTYNEGDVFAPGGFSNHAVVGDLYFWQNSFSQVGGNRLYMTKAGGAWTKLWESDGTLGGAGAFLVFPTATEGWMASINDGTPHRFFVGRSSDGGKTWKKHEIKDKDLVRGNAMLLHAIDKDRGWCASDLCNHVYASTNSGQTWTPHELGNGPNTAIRGLQFRDAKTGYVLCGNEWHIRQTSDGGKSWKSLGKIGPSGPGGVNGVFFTPSGIGYVVGVKGYIARFQPK